MDITCFNYKNFKYTVLLSILIATAAVADDSVNAEAPEVTSEGPAVVRSVDEKYPDGGYKFSFELSDGSLREEEGKVKYGYISVKGFYAWTDEEGKHRINYSAGDKGSKFEVVEGPQEAAVPTYLANIKVK